MLIEEFLSSFDHQRGQRKVFSFETFALHLVKEHIESQHKKFSLLDHRFGSLGDAVAPNGFDDFEGRTLIEVKFSLLPSRMLVDQLAYRLSKTREVQDVRNLLLIVYRPVDERAATMIVSQMQAVHADLRVVIWGTPKLKQLADLYPDRAQSIAGNLFSLGLETAVNTPTGNWESERDERLATLKAGFETGQFSLFLGAGVSASAGMPDWNTLLNSLFVNYLTNEFNHNSNISDADIKQIVNRLGEIDAPSALMAARYLRKGLAGEASDSSNFAETITKNLYKLRDKRRKFNSELVVSISTLCIPRRTGAKVDSVVTYNFDDLLERQLSASSIQLRSIYSESDAHDPDELPIYHVHGFLPETSDNYEGLDKSTLVFSEEGYHQIYGDAYHWSNLVQLSKLRANTCLMIGLSMTDPNLRRLLEISTRNNDTPRHFAFMQRINLERFVSETDLKTAKKKTLVKNKKAAQQFLDRHHSLNEQIMRELGVSVIWFKDFEEVPELLQKIG